jgi:hypothetical protein
MLSDILFPFPDLGRRGSDGGLPGLAATARGRGDVVDVLIAGHEDATPTKWSAARDQLRDAKSYQLTTFGPMGRSHETTIARLVARRQRDLEAVDLVATCRRRPAGTDGNYARNSESGSPAFGSSQANSSAVGPQSRLGILAAMSTQSSATHRRGTALLILVLLVACSPARNDVAAPPSQPEAPTASARTTESPSPSQRPSRTPMPSATSCGGRTSPPSAAPAAASWRMAGSFDSNPGTSYATDVAAWGGGFIAIGSAWESEFHVTAELPVIWNSADGETWEQLTVDLGVSDLSLIGIATRSDGCLLMMGRTPGTGEAIEPLAPGSLAWVSQDGITWEEIPLPIQGDALVTSFDHGPRGFVLTDSDGSLWFSQDGIDWSVTYDEVTHAAAGEEGFIALRGPSLSVIASADGQTWHDASPSSPPLSDVAPIGSDWVGLGSDDSGILIFHSANGLDWNPVLNVNDLTGPDGPKTGGGLNEPALGGASLIGGAGHAFVSLTNNHCCAQMSWNYGVWGSLDSKSWAPVIEGDAFVSSSATDGVNSILAGHLGRGNDAAFWIADR